ncbi:MAG: hypothetical protein OEW68_04440 [Gammaproteobacteria bacterium]|nr:hypothetical protein [Gammaproteobacteria bacterium]MDH4314072.1 hypothetical protein [Gammaproteobacteria bacterium]MDH5213115.1 hypothetical protein [Gammaproteobacteria bacterium]
MKPERRRTRTLLLPFVTVRRIAAAQRRIAGRGIDGIDGMRPGPPIDGMRPGLGRLSIGFIGRGGPDMGGGRMPGGRTPYGG